MSKSNTKKKTNVRKNNSTSKNNKKKSASRKSNVSKKVNSSTKSNVTKQNNITKKTSTVKVNNSKARVKSNNQGNKVSAKKNSVKRDNTKNNNINIKDVKTSDKSVRKSFKTFISFVVLILIFVFIYFKFIKVDNNVWSNVLSITGPDRVYIAINQSRKPNFVVETQDGTDNYELYYATNNEKVVTVSNTGKFEAKGQGTANVVVSSINGVSKSIEVTVTDLIKPMSLVNDKSELPCGKYSEEEAAILDDILLTRIEDAGYKTRAGVVAAARFLALEFAYNINYFYENGRLAGTDRKYIDAEGRYYHKGLYLSEDKFESLESNASTNDPVIWGCDLYSYGSNAYSRNGLNCSGFVSWAMLNGGFDVGDIGAGITEQHDFTDIGEKVNIDMELLTSDRLKVGDLIGRNGHIAIIIGLEDNMIYVAESYIPNLKVRKFTYDQLIESDDFKYVMLMDSVYENDGNLTNMW